MNFEKLPLKLLIHGDTLLEGELYLYEKDPNDNNQVLIEVSFNDQKISKTGDNFFRALQNLRKKLENKHIQIICNGAALNVYPSPMQMSMGSCRTAYLLQLGQQAKRIDIVDIFSCLDSLTFVSVKEQELFYKKWIKSI